MTNFNNKIIVAPLDWGLGHATRCVPIIATLIANGYQLTLAGTKETLALLNQEFSNIPNLILPSYHIAYKKIMGSHRLYLLWQVMRLKKTIRLEQEIIESYCKKNNINHVISDNRYGAYLKTGTSVFITHQLQIATGFGDLADGILQKIHYRFLRPFTQIWVPDFESAIDNLSGVLSHTKLPNKPVYYIGPLSRLQFIKATEKKYHFAFIASGPEPYKTQFINKAIALALMYNKPIIIIGGQLLPTNLPAALPSHITYLPHVNASQMQTIVNQCQYTICRSGYSSIMDAAATKAKCIMLPTPGQTEQIYLVKYLAAFKYILPVKNMETPLANLFEIANNYTFEPWLNNDTLKLPL